MLDIERKVNGFRNGVTGAFFHTVIVDGPEDENDEDKKFLVVVFEDKEDEEDGGQLYNEGCIAVFRINDLNALNPDVDGAQALSAWRPEWAHEKAKPLIKEYHDRWEERMGMSKTSYPCPRCHKGMKEVGLGKQLRCSNEECGS